MNPPGEWKVFGKQYRFISEEIGAVYGIVTELPRSFENKYIYYWEARVNLLARTSGGLPFGGYSKDVLTAQEIVEFLLYKTGTVEPKKEW